MSAWQPVSEKERARATFRRCEGQLRQAQEQARRAGETLRKALRSVTEAEEALGEATRRLDRGDGQPTTVREARPADRSRHHSMPDSAPREYRT